MKKFSTIIITAIFSLHVLTLSGQAESAKPGFTAWYDLMSLLGDQVSNSTGIGIGAEVATWPGQGLEAGLMYIFHCASCGKPYTSITTDDMRGYRISAAYRFYVFQSKTPMSGFHLGPAAEYQHTAYEMDETYGGGIPNTYRVYRNLVAAHAMAGYRIRVAGPLYLDPELGLGIRYISSRNEGKMGAGPGQHEFLYNKDFESGAQWFPSIQASIKIGFKL